MPHRRATLRYYSLFNANDVDLFNFCQIFVTLLVVYVIDVEFGVVHSFWCTERILWSLDVVFQAFSEDVVKEALARGLEASSVNLASYEPENLVQQVNNHRF